MGTRWVRTKMEALNRRDRGTHLFHLGQLPACVFVVTEILLVPHKNDGDIGTEMFDFRGPFLWNVLYKIKTPELQIEYLKSEWSSNPRQGQRRET